MAKIPDRPEEIFEEITQDYEDLFGVDLISIVLYGSGARGHYVPKRSDINFLIVLTQAGIARLDRAIDYVAKWRKRNVAVPLCLTRKYIQSALDTFPIEFLDMKNGYTVVYGMDVLQDLVIEKEHVRHQVERELRGKLIYLREGLLGAGQDRESLSNMLAASVPAFASIFEGLLYLKDRELPAQTGQIFEATAEVFGLDGSVFTQLLNIKTGQWHGSRVQLQEITMSYISEIKSLVEIVDSL